MAGDDDSRDDAERTRIGGMPPPVPKPAGSAPAAPAAPASSEPPEGDRTQIAPARPPAVPGAGPVSPPAKGSPDDAGDRTRLVGGAPPRPLAPGAPAAGAAVPSAPAAPDAGERTRIVTGGPPGAPRAPAPAPSAGAPPPAAPVAPAAAEPAADVTVDPLRGRAGRAGSDEEERTVVLPRRVEATIRLRRVAPSGQAEVMTLDRPSFVLGRGHGCDVKLYTPTASREHARIFFHDGRWRVAPLERKTIYLDGRRQSEADVALDNGTRLKLGDDELVVEEATGSSSARAASRGLWARLVAFVKGLVGRRG